MLGLGETSKFEEEQKTTISNIFFFGKKHTPRTLTLI